MSKRNLKAISAKLIAMLERDHADIQYCLLLIGERGNSRSNTRLESNISKDALRSHFLKVLDTPDIIETDLD